MAGQRLSDQECSAPFPRPSPLCIPVCVCVCVYLPVFAGSAALYTYVENLRTANFSDGCDVDDAPALTQRGVCHGQTNGPELLTRTSKTIFFFFLADVDVYFGLFSPRCLPSKLPDGCSFSRTFFHLKFIDVFSRLFAHLQSNMASTVYL